MVTTVAICLASLSNVTLYCAFWIREPNNSYDKKILEKAGNV